MAKRARGTTRPGQRRPVQRAAARPGETAPRPSGSLTAAEEARAAELEAQIVAEERAAAQNAGSRPRDRRAAEPARATRAAAGGLLSAKAAEEYTYVVADIRRIVVLAGALFGVLLLLWFLREGVGII